MATFPAELIDSIIDYLSSNSESLSALSLTSWICLPRARRHMFGTLDIQLSSPRHSQFLSLLRSLITQRTLIPFIHTFSISGVQTSVFTEGPDSVLKALRDLPKLVNLLPNVDSLRIAKSNLGCLSDPIVSELISVMESRLEFARPIRSLSFSDLDFRDGAVFEDLLGGMIERHSQGLECVTIGRVKSVYNLTRGRVYRSDTPSKQASRITWNLLEMRGHDLYNFTDWLLRSTHFVRIQVLHLQPVTAEHSSAFRSLMTYSPTEWIRDLTVWFPLWSNNPAEIIDTLFPPPSPDAANTTYYCPSLTYLKFKQIVLYPGDSTSECINSRLMRALEMFLLSGSLLNVILEIMVTSYTYNFHQQFGDWSYRTARSLAQFDWAGLKELLRRSSRSASSDRLRVLELHLYPTQSQSEVLAAAMQLVADRLDGKQSLSFPNQFRLPESDWVVEVRCPFMSHEL